MLHPYRLEHNNSRADSDKGYAVVDTFTATTTREVLLASCKSSKYLKEGHDGLMLAVGGMLAEAARQRFVHVKLGTHEVGSTHADRGTATAAAGQRMLMLQLQIGRAHV